MLYSETHLPEGIEGADLHPPGAHLHVWLAKEATHVSTDHGDAEHVELKHTCGGRHLARVGTEAATK